MKAGEALRWGAGRIGGETARLDAQLLLAHLLGVTREVLLLGGLGGRVDAGLWAALVERRVSGEPVAYIVGEREFWSMPLRVSPDVLVPRPDSETLVEAALEMEPCAAVLDLGTGSGALLLAVLSEWPRAWGLGVDRSEAAVNVARGNAAALGLGGRAAFLVGDWAESLNARFGLVLCNPPYVADGEAAEAGRYEPRGALYAGADGLDAYRRLIPALPRLLAPGGAAVIEIGWDQADNVGKMAAGAGFAPVLRRDIAGRGRAFTLRQAR